MKRLAIVGAGDLGQQIAHHATDSGYSVVGFFDDFQHEVLGKLSEVETVFKQGDFDVLMIGIGYNHMKTRSELFNKFHGNIPFAQVIHSSAIIDPSCTIGEGVFIYPGCVLDMNVIVENNVLLNAGCVIAHDSHIHRNCMLSPGVIVSGFVKIHEKVNLGTGTKVIDNITISTMIRTGAGAVVTKDLEKKGLYVGVPALFKKP
jgi:sugar O-acyltransferase (sialic acid O-acetyltransferase NeuD family)